MDSVLMRFGKIDQIGDPNKPEEVGRYRVHIAEENIVTGWLYQVKRSSKENQDDWVYDIGEPVVIFVQHDYRTGIIDGAINTKKSQPSTTDKDTAQMKFKDGSYIKYDRNSHEYDIYIKSGTVNLKSDTDFKIDSANGTVIINGGNNKGMVNIVPLTQVVNNIQNDLNQIKSIFTAWVPVPQDGGAGLKGPASVWASAQITPTQQSDIEDTKATH